MIPSFLSCARRSDTRQTFKTMYKAVQGRDMQLLEDCSKEGNYFLTAINMIEN